jgi:hypothetical protein
MVTRLGDLAVGAIDCLKMDALGLGMASFGTDNERGSDGERCALSVSEYYIGDCFPKVSKANRRKTKDHHQRN